ncbi:lysophospholipid acyltransferase family protein [Rhodococcus sp. IEGM 1408]|uniref:lysophospholipid acyltransferase family protein n=1 Tax=Rhodococcus sp. IEGM 1408 TaxID=3082220 RepID=UPI0029539890|nr:lysophospholipid acyltransferase family protein [Rhodococcus sp. IEGM 1408]MDV8001987.1 lysophospholipid acyltransferase family protein [Rhodococcus sp. IEGM 1408]
MNAGAGHRGRAGVPRRRGGGRPEVTVSNYEAVYDYYGPGRRRDGFTHPLLRFVGALYAPDLRIAPETVAEVHRLHDAGVGLIVAANHPSAHDPLVLASAVFDGRVRFLSGGTGLAKDPLFRSRLRPLFEYTGTVPVFRAKNYVGTGAEIHEAAAARLIEVCVNRLVSGGVVLTFVEGTNSSADDLRTLRLESVKKGVGLMVAGAREAGGEVAVLPVGIAYHGREHATLPPRHAALAVAPPLVWGGNAPAPAVSEVQHAVRDGIDDALTAAWT